MEILSVDPRAAETEGITFFLLIDNSGSMYDRIDGTPTDERSETRMTAVQEAIRTFTDRIDNPRDQIALATFNTHYRLLLEPTSSMRTVDRILEEIPRPEADDAYTELYRAGISPTEYRRVRIGVTAGGGPGAETEREYFAGTLFGLPRADYGALFLLPFLGALLLAAILAQLRFRNTRGRANVEVLTPGGATHVLDLAGEKTVIGAAAGADVTIAGSPDMRDNHATIVHDEKRGTYTVVATDTITVNNKATTNRELRPGDVIELPGATVVFDVPEDQEPEGTDPDAEA